VAIFGVGIVKQIDDSREILYIAIVVMGMFFILYSLLAARARS